MKAPQNQDTPGSAPITLPPATLRDTVVSAGLWAAGAAWIAPMLTTLTTLHKVAPKANLYPLTRLYCWGQVKLLGVDYTPIVDPAVDPTRPYMFMQNHTNHFDHVVLCNAVAHFLQGLELREHFKYPVYGSFMKARGTIPVDKGRGGQSAEVMAAIQTEVDKGRSILTFPEGTRTTTGRIGPFRKGLFYIARDVGIPIVPVSVTGMYETMRKGSMLLRPGATLTVHVDAPVATAGLTDDELDQTIAQVRGVMTGRVDRYWDRQGHDPTPTPARDRHASAEGSPR